MITKRSADQSGSLTRRALIQVAVRIAAVVVVATVISYYHVSSSLQTQALEQLREYITQRGVRESSLFDLARDNLRLFAEDYLSHYQALDEIDPGPEFDALFVTHEDGTIRVRDSFYTREGVSGVIGKQARLSDDLRRRLILAYDMLARYGPAWRNRLVNLYVMTPEGAMLMYWPDMPWGLSANSWEVQARLAQSMAKAAPGTDTTTIASLPEQRATWSDLYFDYAVNDWMVSATEMVVADQQPLVSVGNDLLLEALIERVNNSRLEGTYSLMFDREGLLLAHPRHMDAIRASNGALSVAGLDDPNLKRIVDRVQKSSADGAILENTDDQEYLAVARLEGPDWYLVTVFPRSIIAARAFETARLILLLGAGALLLEMLILLFVFRKQVAQPLNRLLVATNRISAGDFGVRLDENRRDEIGHLGRAFNTMTTELNAREEKLNERSARLATLNQQLQAELEERKRAEAEIDRQRDALHQSEKMSALGSLLAGVAHELNNPLSVVVGRAGMMEQEAKDPALRDQTRKIREAAERCARIVRTFLAIARQQTPERASLQVNDLVQSAVELLSYGLRTADVKTELDLDPGLPPVWGDADQLSQVFTNIIVNAQHALRDVPPPRELCISSRSLTDEKKISVAFTDNGPGVAEDLRSRIFEPFYTSKPVGVGTGIGLSFSYGVAQSHDGDLALEEAAGGGARFVLTLPTAGELDSELATERDSELPVDTSSMILVVDDEPDIAELLEEILSLDGHQTDIAKSGNAALSCLNERRYDLILSDLNMPDLDGPGLYRHFEQHHPKLLERLVFVTGDTLSAGRGSFLAEVQCEVIEKPFAPDDVNRVVRRVLQASSSEQ